MSLDLRGFRIAAASYAGPPVRWFHLEPLAPDFTEPCHAVIAFPGGHAFATDLVPSARALGGRFCRIGGPEQAIEAAGGSLCFARGHIGSAIHLIGRVVDNAEVQP